MSCNFHPNLSSPLLFFHFSRPLHFGAHLGFVLFEQLAMSEVSKYQEPPSFSGKMEEDFESFIIAWQWVAVNNNWSKQSWRTRIALSFTGDAKVIHDTIFDNENLSFEELISKMKTCFLPNVDEQIMAEQVRSLKQGKDETVTQFCARLLRKSRKNKPFLDYVTKGALLSNVRPSIRKRLLGKNFNSFVEAYHATLKAELKEDKFEY